MAGLDWILVVFGAVVALAGGWIQLHPEDIVPGQPGLGQLSDCPLDPAARAQLRRLGACFLFMGTFFALQMTIDLMRRPWWAGSVSGLVTSIAAVSLVYDRVRQQQRRSRRAVQQSPLGKKALELR